MSVSLAANPRFTIIEPLTAADDHWRRQPRDPGGKDGGRWVDSPAGGAKKALRTTVAIFRKDIKHDDVIAESGDGGRRVRWHAAEKKFIFEERAETTASGWRATARLNKSATYKRMQGETKDWFEPGQTHAEAPKAPSQDTPQPPAVPAPQVEPAPTSPATPGGVQNTARLAAVRARIAKIDAEARQHAEVDATITQKAGTGKILTSSDLIHADEAQKTLAKLVADARPLADEELELLLARDGQVWGSVPGVSGWPKTKPVTITQPGTDTVKMSKIRDSYVVNDKKTIEHNASLRSASPSPAARSWRSRIRTLIRSERVAQDSTAWRGAALPASVIAGMRPGSVLTDAGIMSTDEDESGARFYMSRRLSRMPGRLPVLFEVRVPAGVSAVDVGYGEIVFDADTQMRVLTIKRDPDGTVRVLTEMLPGKKSGK